MNKVLQFPATVTMTPDQALDSAKQSAPIDVLVVAYDADGELIIRSSRMNLSDALWLIEKAKAYVLSGGEAS
jgi:hypothetical protein